MNFKNFLTVFIFTFITSLAFADHGRPSSPRPHPLRDYPISTEGKGGTTNGDRDAACGRAEDRAFNTAERQCYDRYDGDDLYNIRFSSCDCRRVQGSRDDYNCEVTLSATCSTRR